MLIKKNKKKNCAAQTAGSFHLKSPKEEKTRRIIVRHCGVNVPCLTLTGPVERLSYFEICSRVGPSLRSILEKQKGTNN